MANKESRLAALEAHWCNHVDTTGWALRPGEWDHICYLNEFGNVEALNKALRRFDVDADDLNSFFERFNEEY